MKRFITITLVILIALVFVSGCAQIPFVKSSSATATSSGSSTKNAAEQGTYGQVPESMRGDVTEAEYDLRQAGINVKLAEEKLKMAELEKEQATLGEKYAEYNKKLFDILQKKAETTVEVKKMEAIENAGLGDKVDNLKRLNHYKNNELKITIEENDVRLDMSTIEIQLKELKKKIQAQAEVVAKAGGMRETAKLRTKEKRSKGKK